MFIRKNAANIITVSRIVFSLAMLFFPLFSIGFWVFYSLAGLTDMVDGLVARVLKSESKTGAILDSVADLAFFIVIACLLLPKVSLASWMIVSVAIIAALRITSYIVAFSRFHVFVSLHTYLNKLTGLLLFLCPILFYFLGLLPTVIILVSISFLSSLEELLIDATCNKVNRDQKGIFFDRKRISEAHDDPKDDE